MMKLDSVLKSRDSTLPTKVHIVKAMIFPVVMYGWENSIIKKAEHQRIYAFELWCWRRLLRVSWTARRSDQSILRKSTLSIHWKDWCWSWSSNILASWYEEPNHWKRLWCWESKSKRRRWQQRIRWLNSTTNSMDINLSKLQEIVEDPGAWHAAVHAVTKSQWLSGWTTTEQTLCFLLCLSRLIPISFTFFVTWEQNHYLPFLHHQKNMQ